VYNVCLEALHCIPKFVQNYAFRRKYFNFKLWLAEIKIFYQGLALGLPGSLRKA
jgi:hypothetical protein